ncbi:hypothetical protein FHG87_023903 [Trinorchestia longiramus]|nr:hypothetical protein FHG87_023903 [Trinorchestia longiramus]
MLPSYWLMMIPGALALRHSSSSRPSRAPQLPQSQSSSKSCTSSPATAISQPNPKPLTTLIPPILPSTPATLSCPAKAPTYRVQLKTIDLAKPTDKQKIFEITFRELNAPLIRLTTTRTGYYAVTDDVTSIDKLTSKKATTAFEKINLTPIIPPDLQAKWTVFIRQIDADIGLKPAEEIKNEIKRQNDWLTVTEVIKIKTYTHLLKLVTTDTTTAQQLLRQGLYIFHTKITPQQCEQEKYTHILICYKSTRSTGPRAPAHRVTEDGRALAWEPALPDQCCQRRYRTRVRSAASPRGANFPAVVPCAPGLDTRDQHSYPLSLAMKSDFCVRFALAKLLVVSQRRNTFPAVEIAVSIGSNELCLCV